MNMCSMLWQLQEYFMSPSKRRIFRDSFKETSSEAVSAFNTIKSFDKII